MTNTKEYQMPPLRKYEEDSTLEPGEVENIDEQFDDVITEDNYINYNLPAENYNE